MSKSTRAANESIGGTTGRTDPRPNYILLGTDTEGANHCYDTTTETVHIVHADGSRARKILYDTSKTVDDYVEVVADARGWATRRYGRDLLGELIAAHREAEQ